MIASTEEQGKEVQVFVVGEKGRSQLARLYAEVRMERSSCRLQ